ncbi:acyl-CoA dehydrogenase family protein [Thermodesulfobacteriota bacterium]
MDFKLTERQAHWKESVKKFAQKEVAPFMVDIDRKAEFSWEIWKKIVDFKLPGMMLPKEYGGGGEDVTCAALAFEGFGAGGGSIGTGACWSVTMCDCGMGITLFGTEEQKKKFLPKICAGQWIGAFGLTEPNAGSDTAALETTAVRDGDHYILNGTKIFITNAPICHFVLTITYTDKSKGPREGLSVFLVEVDSPGFSRGEPYQAEKMGERAATTSELYLKDCKVPVENRLGSEGEGSTIMREILFWERGIVMDMLVGVMENVIEKTIEYAKKRVAFGKPIAQHQVVQHKIADMKVLLEATRLLVYNMVWKKQEGTIRTIDTSITRVFLADALMKVSSEAVQIHGGRGYMREYEVERVMRDAKLVQIAGGSQEIQRNIIGSRLVS